MVAFERSLLHAVLACCPKVGATSDGHVEYMGSQASSWQDFRHMSVFLLIVPSLSTLGGNSSYS